MQIGIEIWVYPSLSATPYLATGSIELAAVPRIGELVSFRAPTGGAALDLVPGFSGLLEVETVYHVVGAKETVVDVLLETIKLDSPEHTDGARRFFEVGFGLSFEPRKNDL